MPTPEPSGFKAERPAERALFRALFDDAAVFPPGLTPLPQAVADHVARQSSSYAGSDGFVGPLLVPASAVEDLMTLQHPHLEVALVGRPGTDLMLVGEALNRLNESAAVTVTGVEIGWSRDWHKVGVGIAARPGPLGSTDALRSIEVPRDIGLGVALADLVAHTSDLSPVQAKFRTGSTPGQPAPTSTEVATFIRACVDHDLSFKLTGGLHHAISQASPEGPKGQSQGEDRLGFLNVIAATRYALAHGAEVPEMDSLLCERDPVPIVDIVTRMSAADASVLRAFFTSYGCCGVMDPISDLAALGLITEQAV